MLVRKTVSAAHMSGNGRITPTVTQIERTPEEALQYQLMQHGSHAVVHCIFLTLTESQQLRVLEQLGWKEVPQPIPPKVNP
jgi:hypothetical protein